VMDCEFLGPEPLPPATPTGHPPGSPEKIATMRERAARGESVFHPLDARATLCHQVGGDVRPRTFVSAVDYDAEQFGRQRRRRRAKAG
jgi:hypothetical protein